MGIITPPFILVCGSSGTWVLADPPPNFQQELAKCQRYFVTYNFSGQRFCGIAEIDSASFGQGIIFTPVRMRINPTISGKISIYGSANNSDLTSFDVQGIGNTGVFITFTLQNAINSPTQAFLYSSYGSQLLLSAEL